jgi:hypothetical protein
MAIEIMVGKRLMASIPEPPEKCPVCSRKLDGRQTADPEWWNGVPTRKGGTWICSTCEDAG